MEVWLMRKIKENYFENLIRYRKMNNLTQMESGGRAQLF